MQIQIGSHIIPNVQEVTTLSAAQRAEKACELKLQMMIAVGAMRPVAVREDDGTGIVALDAFEKVSTWISENIANDLEQYQYVETSVLPRWAES
jgi:hypothetical protein